MKVAVKIQSLPDIATLPQDRESVYYFNLREIPPRSKEANVLQIALQTRIKLFYRPKALYATRTDLENPWQEKITLTRKGDAYEITNPTAYFVTIVDASAKVGGDTVKQFEPVMISPKSNGMLKGSASAMGAKPVLTYINDYGGRPKLTFGCAGTTCKVESSTDR